MDKNLKLLMNKMPLGIIVFNGENEIQFFNVKAQDCLFPALDIHVNGFMNQVNKLVLATREKGSAQERHISFKHGKEIYSCRARAEIAGFISSEAIMIIFQDVDNSIRMEQAILQAEELAVAGQLARDAMLEIRNPLTIVLGFCQLMKLHSNDQDNYPPNVNLIIEEVKKIFDILQDYSLQIKQLSEDNAWLEKPINKALGNKRIIN